MDAIPIKSDIHQFSLDASFADSFSQYTKYENQSALDIYLELVRDTPEWVNHLMALRNKVVSLFGLKHLGHLGSVSSLKSGSEYKVGERVGIFKLYLNLHNEVILEDRDKHLDVKISLYVEPQGGIAKIHLSTVVHVKNRLGRVYMFFVAPVHKIIVPAVLNKLART
jgi:hypothetical protein